jgi:RNA polymerase sigma-70 factor (ECF subfamily)
MVAGSRAAAEDAVQEALARAWERSDRGERIDSLEGWVTRVAMNLSRSRFRRIRAEARARERLSAQGRGPLTDAQTVETRLDVAKALAALPRQQRAAAVLRYYLDMDVREIARVLGISEGTAKTTLFRARRKLAAALGEPEVEEESDRAEHR